MVEIHGTTTLVGLLGWPTSHSLSPRMQNAGFAALGLDWAYVPLPTPPELLADAVRGLVATGFAGANVTIPHKKAVLDLCDEVDEVAARAGSVNTLVVEDGRVLGSSTDGDAVASQVDAAGRSALVLGAGGAAAAVVEALERAGADVTVTGRRDPGWPPDGGGFDVLVNATPVKDELLVSPASVAAGRRPRLPPGRAARRRSWPRHELRAVSASSTASTSSSPRASPRSSAGRAFPHPRSRCARRCAGGRRAWRVGRVAVVKSVCSLGSRGSVLSLASDGSILSVGSVGSFLSVGSVGSVLSVLSIGSAGSLTSVLSFASSRSLLSSRASDSALGVPMRPSRRRALAVAFVAVGVLLASH